MMHVFRQHTLHKRNISYGSIIIMNTLVIIQYNFQFFKEIAVYSLVELVKKVGFFRNFE